MNSPFLHIRHWRNDFVVSCDHPAPERVHVDLDDITGRLTDELVSGLDRWLSDQSDSVVLIERLSFDCELDLSREPELLAARWAYRFAKTLVEAIESNAEGVLRFSSPAAYRTQFISDLTSGSSGSAWYYRSFAGLAALPPAGAIRTLLLEDLELGREILTALPPDVWNRLGTVLTRREALRILNELSAGGSSEEIEPVALAALYSEHAAHLPSIPWFVIALYLFSAALRTGFDATPDLARWVRLAAKLPDLATRVDVPALAEALRRGDIAALVATEPDMDADSWQPLTTKAEWRAALAEALEARTEKTGNAPDHSSVKSICTAFGGLTLLLSELDSLLDEELAAVLPPFERGSSRDLTALVVLALCTGQGRISHFLNEAFWQEFFDVPAQLDRAVLLDWLADVDSAAAVAILNERATALTHDARLPATLRINGRRWLILVDQATGLWCKIEESETEPVFHSIPWRARLAASRRVRDDWRYLAMNWGLPESWQQLFTHMAQIVLRRFAYRIPGFAGTSLPYMYTNFLAGPGTLDPETRRLQLVRPPLHVLLNMTGIGRGTVRWSLLPERYFLLDYAP